jgi:hypothetical protein
MPIAAKVLVMGLLVWFALLAAIVAGRILRGDIRVDGLLSGDPESRNRVDPERIANLAIFPSVLLFYIIHALNSDLTLIGNRPVMPDIPESLVALLTGGNGIYLAGKIVRRGNGDAK